MGQVLKRPRRGWHCCSWRKRNTVHPRTDALRLHCDAHLGVALDGLTTCPGQPINEIHPRIRLIFCASRDAPHISPASVIFVRQRSRKWLMVVVFKANFQIDWTIRQGKNTVRGTRCSWVNGIMSGRSPPLC